MSWVAEKKAMHANTDSVEAKKNEAGRHIATASIVMVMNSCMLSVHRRFVENMSTNGLQSGRMIQGSDSSPVHAVICGMDIPISQ